MLAAKFMTIMVMRNPLKEKENRLIKMKPSKETSETPQTPKKYDLEAAHRKAVMIMIGIFVAILLLMVFLQDHVEFASSGGM